MDGRVAVKRGCSDTFDAHREQFALVALAPVEDHNLVGARAPHHAPASLLAAAFDKDFHSLTDKRLVKRLARSMPLPVRPHSARLMTLWLTEVDEGSISGRSRAGRPCHSVKLHHYQMSGWRWMPASVGKT